VKQTARRRRRYVAMSSSSSSAAATPPTNASSEGTPSIVAAEELRAGDTVDFGESRMSSVRVQDMQQLGYFGGGVARVPGAEEVPKREGELVVFEAFFVAGLRLPTHRFVGEVLRRFNVQVHQLTPNAVVALSKYVWASTSYGRQPSVEVFAKYYCLHWQKRMIGNKIAQFGSCTFTPKTGKTSMEVVELVPCARNKWGNWYEFWFYVAEGTVEDHPGLPVAEMCSHYYSAYPQFEVAEEDADEGALRCAAGLSSGRDLVEEFVAYGVWPLARGWALGEVCPRQMPSRGGMLVRSPAFALDLHSRDPTAFVREAKDGTVRIVGRYVPKTEGQRSWDIRGSNDRLNRVFELNRLPNGHREPQRTIFLNVAKASRVPCPLGSYLQVRCTPVVLRPPSEGGLTARIESNRGGTAASATRADFNARVAPCRTHREAGRLVRNQLSIPRRHTPTR
jgi:hypothetical protein